MLNEDETLTIEQCPKCKARHVYQLIISRSPMWYSGYKGTFAIEQHFTKSFTCPQTGESFQENITVLESPYMIIKSLQVKIIPEITNNDRKQKSSQCKSVFVEKESSLPNSDKPAEDEDRT